MSLWSIQFMAGTLSLSPACKPLKDTSIKRYLLKMHGKMNKWQYLGDGVYCKFDQWGVWLHANDHENPTDKIYLEWQVFEQLISNARYLENGK